MPKAWAKLRARAQRATGGMEYFAVPELHKSKKVHFHMIVTAKLTKKWWKDNGRECGFGFRNDAKEVYELGGVASYINKYLVKSLSVESVPKGTRRVRTSHGWPRAPDRDPDPDWTFSLVERDTNVEYLAQAYENMGFSVALAGSKSAWTYVEAK